MNTSNRKPYTKTRGARASVRQISFLVDTMSQDREFACSQYSHSRSDVKKKWEKLSAELNSIGKSQKSIDQWRTTWRDLKCHTISKLKNLTNDTTDPKNIEFLFNSCSSIKDIDRKILTAVGYCPDGETSSLIDLASMIQEQSLESKDQDAHCKQDSSDIIDIDELTEDIEIKNEPLISNNFEEESVNCSETDARTRSKPGRIHRRRRMKDQFLTIAGIQANNMTIFAQAFEKLASAVEKISDATNKFAEAALLRAQTEAMRAKIDVGPKENELNK